MLLILISCECDPLLNLVTVFDIKIIPFLFVVQTSKEFNSFWPFDLLLEDILARATHIFLKKKYAFNPRISFPLLFSKGLSSNNNVLLSHLIH